jgi:hypothetical protein
LLRFRSKVSEHPCPSRILRPQNDFVVPDRNPVLLAAEAHPGEQRSSWNHFGLTPRLALVVAQQDMPPLAHRDQAAAGRGNIEQKRT